MEHFEGVVRGFQDSLLKFKIPKSGLRHAHSTCTSYATWYSGSLSSGITPSFFVIFQVLDMHSIVEPVVKVSGWGHVLHCM